MENQNTYDFTCYFDGACEPKNPGGNLGIGAIILDRNEQTVVELSHYVAAKPDNSNNVAEYCGFGWVVTELSKIMKEGQNALIMGDSKLVVCQMNGEWQMKGGMYMEKALKAKAVLTDLRKKCGIKIIWIPRAENERADALSKAPMIANNVQFKLQPNL